MFSNNAARALPRDERMLREQRALELGPSDSNHLRLVARDIESEGIIELPGVDAERLRLLARQLEDGDPEVESLREHAANLHRALCEAISDIDAIERDDKPVLALFITPASVFETLDALTPEQFSDLAVFLLDEVE